MKLVLFLHAGLSEDRLHQIAEQLALPAHTDLGVIHGSGSSGRHEGSRAFPGSGRAMFAVVEEAHAERLLPDVRRIRDALPPGERLRVLILPVEQML
ncbi:MAG TPA: hypothetical protein VFN22_12395 [Gemmatimonadales bacterium]|nr:hypothetical protein [Gemmatimonadales bacterium]